MVSWLSSEVWRGWDWVFGDPGPESPQVGREHGTLAEDPNHGFREGLAPVARPDTDLVALLETVLEVVPDLARVPGDRPHRVAADVSRTLRPEGGLRSIEGDEIRNGLGEMGLVQGWKR